jgi:hypothetical protein
VPESLAAAWELYGTGAARVRLEGVSAGLATTALEAAGRAVTAIRHPEEPDGPLPSYVSQVESVDGGFELWFDIADAEVYDGLLDSVEAAVVAAITSVLDHGRLVVPADPDDDPRLLWEDDLTESVDSRWPVDWPATFPLIPGATWVSTDQHGHDCWTVVLKTPAATQDTVAFLETDLERKGFTVRSVLERRRAGDPYGASIFCDAASVGFHINVTGWQPGLTMVHVERVGSARHQQVIEEVTRLRESPPPGVTIRGRPSE